MLVPRPTLHPKAAAVIQSLEKKGLYPSADHIVWLQDAAGQFKRATRDSMARMIDAPIECGGVDFYPLTLLAIDWLVNLPADLQSDLLVQAFASAHGRDSDALTGMRVPWRVRLAVWGWARTVKASKMAISEVMAEVGESEEMADIPCKGLLKPSKPSRRGNADFGAVAFELCRKYPGTSPEFWLCEVSSVYAIERLESNGGKSKLTGADITAQVAFRSIVAAIESELKAEADHG